MTNIEKQGQIKEAMLIKELLDQRESAWKELKYIASHLGLNSYGSRFARARNPALLEEPQWHWEEVSAPDKSLSPFSMDCSIAYAKWVRMEVAHKWEADPEASFTQLATIIHLLHYVHNNHVVHRLSEEHGAMIVSLQQYGLSFEEALGWIESRDRGFARACMRLRRIVRLDRGIHKAERILGIEEVQGMPIYENWEEFVSRNFSPLFVEPKAKPKSESTKEAEPSEKDSLFDAA